MNKYLKFLYVIGCAVWVFLARQPFALAQSSTNFILEKGMMDQGGSVSSSENYQVVDAIGQPCPIGISASSGYIETSGFLAGGCVVSGVTNEIEQAVPKEFKLRQNYPNPFNLETVLKFQLPVAQYVTLSIYDIDGRLIRRLVDERKEVGYHTVVWDGTDQGGKVVPSGCYIYRLQTERFTKTGKSLLLK